MTTTQAIVKRLESLPEETREEVLDFVEFLASRDVEKSDRNADLAWSEFSLEAAMRGMEDEESLYTLDDLKESRR